MYAFEIYFLLFHFHCYNKNTWKNTIKKRDLFSSALEAEYHGAGSHVSLTYGTLKQTAVGELWSPDIQEARD